VICFQCISGRLRTIDGRRSNVVRAVHFGTVVSDSTTIAPSPGSGCSKSVISTCSVTRTWIPLSVSSRLPLATCSSPINGLPMNRTSKDRMSSCGLAAALKSRPASAIDGISCPITSFNRPAGVRIRRRCEEDRDRRSTAVERQHRPDEGLERDRWQVADHRLTMIMVERIHATCSQAGWLPASRERGSWVLPLCG
jgi:hypothetical protein